MSKHATDAAMIAVDQLYVPEGYASKSSKVDDEMLQNSVRLTGIQQPLIVVAVDDETYYVVDGVRRLNVARSLEHHEVPCVLDHGFEDVKDRDEYRNRIRFILDEHRQDLLPTQRSKLIRQLQNTFGMTARQVGLYLGVTSGTITNWTLVEKVIPEIRQAIDNGQMKVHAARAFAGITDKGQRVIWEKDRDAVVSVSGGRLHKWIRENYSPTDTPELYEAPDQIIKQLNRKQKGRKSRKRSVISRDEKTTLLKDFEAKKIEIEDKKTQVEAFEEDINAAIPIIEAIREDEQLLALLPKKIRGEFEEFADRYIA